MFKKLILIISLAFFASEACAADTTDTVQSREFEIHIPDTVATQKNLPLVIAMHGGGGNAAQFRQQTGLDAVADRNGFIVVYPEGTSGMVGNFRTWNAGHCCGPAMKRNVDDVGFISAMIDKLVKKYNVDPARVYATGHSNGAMMSYRLACELSDKMTAIAPNSGQRVFENCHPKRPVAVLHIHGINDPCALYNGGAQCGGCFAKALGFSLPGDTWQCDPVKQVVADTAKLNGCSETETVFTKGAVSCIRYKGCAAGAPVELCSIDGAGHRWPGSTDIGPPSCQQNPDRPICARYADAVGPVNADINAGDFMWEFFKGIKNTNAK